MNFTRKTAWLGLALLALSTIAKGQSRWALSATAAPLYGYSDTKQDLAMPDVNGQIHSAFFISKSSQTGYRLGLMGNYSFSAHWSLATGLWMSYRKADAPSIQAPINVDYAGYPSRNRSFQVPLLVNYQLTKRRLSPYFSAGVLANFRSKTYLTVSPYQEFTVESTQKTITFQPTIGAGIVYRLNEHIRLAAQPMISYILPERDYAAYQAYALSLQTQLLYRF